MFGVAPDDLRPYPVRWQHPGAQLAARVALWSAVALGCVSGLVALARSASEPTAAPTAAVADAVPAPVAGTAERAVAAWLTATGDDGQDALAGLFVEPVRGSRDAATLDIGEVTTVAGTAVGPGYWWVTVAVDVTEPPPSDTAAGGSDAGDALAEDPVTTTWYVQVAVVGDIESRLAVLTTPQVVPVAPALPSEWQRVEGASIDQGTGPYDTIEGFLRALLLGDGDPSRYMTAGWSIELPAAPMFADLEITSMSVASPTGDGPLRVRVDAAVTTAGGSRRDVAYTVEAIEREGRWEVVELPGGPSVHRRGGDAGGGSAATTSSPPPPPPSTGGGGTAGQEELPPDTWVPDGDTPPPGSETPPPGSETPSSSTPYAAAD